MDEALTKARQCEGWMIGAHLVGKTGLGERMEKWQVDDAEWWRDAKLPFHATRHPCRSDS